MGNKKKLLEVMPKEFDSHEHSDTLAYQFKDVFVKKENCPMFGEDPYKKWPGKHKNVYFWVELENGYAVGWNENPSRGWSFPVIKLM